MSTQRIENLRITVEGPGKGRLYFFDLETSDSYEFCFDVKCGEGKHMETYRITSTHCQYKRDIIRRENASGITLILKGSRMNNREADRMFGFFWRKYLKGQLLKNAEFFE